MKKVLLLCSCVFLIFATTATTSKHKIWILGDSTLCHYSSDDGYTVKRVGWADVLQSFLNTDSSEVHNKAISGESSKHFVNCDNGWNTFKDSISSGDIVIIEFGHNDEKYKTKDTIGVRPDSFKIYLSMYVDFALSKGAIPILGTPIARNKWGGDTINYDHIVKDSIKIGTETTYSFVVTDTNATKDSLYGYYDYPPVTIELAKEKNIGVVDMRKLTEAYFESIGKTAADSLFAVKTDGTLDQTHINNTGALAVCKLFVDNVVSQKLSPLYTWVVGATPVTQVATRAAVSSQAGKVVYQGNGVASIVTGQTVSGFSVASLNGRVINSKGTLLGNNRIALTNGAGQMLPAGMYVVNYQYGNNAANSSKITIR